MKDALYQILISGDSVIAWAAVLLAGLVAKYIIGKIGNDTVRKYVGRAWTEVQAAVAEVYQTYVEALKEGNKDGKLTAREAAEAKARAMRIAKSNIGQKGLERLMRILGLSSSGEVESWLGNKIESAIDTSKKVGTAVKTGAASPLL